MPWIPAISIEISGRVLLDSPIGSTAGKFEFSQSPPIPSSAARLTDIKIKDAMKKLFDVTIFSIRLHGRNLITFFDFA